MTDLMPDPETVTTPIAQRHYTPAVYDTNATAILRPDETLILNVGGPVGRAHAVIASPDTTGDIVPLMRLLQDPPTGTPPPLPVPPAPQVEAWMRPGRTVEYFQDGPPGHVGAHRMPWPRWADQLIGAGWATVAWSLLGLAILAVIR